MTKEVEIAEKIKKEIMDLEAELEARKLNKEK